MNLPALSIPFSLSQITTALYSDNTEPWFLFDFDAPPAFQDFLTTLEDDNRGTQ
jgi:hypothetical protein